MRGTRGWAAGAAVISGLVLLGILSPTGDVRAQEAAPAAVALSDCFSSDHGGQTLTGLWLSDTVVDVRRKEQIVHVTGTATDSGGPGPASGIKIFAVKLGEFGEDHAVSLTTTSLELGTDGKWRGSLIIPAGVHLTTYPLSVYLSDLDGRSEVQYSTTQYYIYSSVWLEEHGFPHHLTVKTRPDRKPPQLRSLTISPRSIDEATRRVRVRARITDNASGVNQASVVFGGPTFSKSRSMSRVRGTPRNGIWAASIPAARFRLGKSWPVGLTASDRAEWQEFEYDHRAVYAAADLRRAGLPSEVIVRADPDRSDPIISDLRAVPEALDARSADATVTVRARIRDVGAGVRVASVGIGQFRAKMALVSGTRKDGVWRGRIVVDRCAARTRSLTPSVWATDFAGNGHSLRDRELRIAVHARDNKRPVRQDCDGSPRDMLVACFSEDVAGITNESAEVRLSEEPHSLVDGSWACADSTGAVSDCQTGPVRIARFTPVPALSGSAQVHFNPEHVLGVMDMAGNPLWPYWTFSPVTATNPD